MPDTRRWYAMKCRSVRMRVACWNVRRAKEHVDGELTEPSGAETLPVQEKLRRPRLSVVEKALAVPAVSGRYRRGGYRTV